MRRISIEQIQPGLILARSIFGSKGQLLLNAGVEIKSQYAYYLKKLGINYIYVLDDRLEGVEVEDVITEETRMEARSLVREMMSNGESKLLKQKSLLLYDEKINRYVAKIIDELLNKKDIVVNLMDLKCAGDYMFAHCVNTCVLATLTATKLGFTRSRLVKLATGALLHDIGTVAVPPEIINKRASLTQDEYEMVKKHPLYGYEIFKKSSLFSATAGAVVYQHHELQDGSGYPQGLKGDNINFLAQIVTVADVYDALTSERPYRKAYMPYQAVEMLSALGQKHFNLKVLQAFLSFVAAYPIGTHVFLSNGESGLVVANTPGFPLHPVVKILYCGESLALHPNPYKLDLTETLNLSIVKVIED